MEVLLLFQIYRVWDLKASQITMKQNNDVLGLFFTWYIQVLIGLWVRQQFSLPESTASPWRFAACCQSRSTSLWRSWTAVAGENWEMGGGEREERKKEKISLLVLTRYRLLIRNISAVKSITTLTQLTLCWWCVYQRSCLEIWGLCSLVLLSPKPLCAHRTQMPHYPSPCSLSVGFFPHPQYFKIFIW